MSVDPIELAEEIVTAVNGRDSDGLVRLLDRRSQVVTGRSTRTGPEEIADWAAREYDHLVRRYAIDEWCRGEGVVLGIGSVQYVWSDGGAVADSSPIALEFAFADGGYLRRLHVVDDVAAALGAFED